MATEEEDDQRTTPERDRSGEQLEEDGEGSIEQS